MRCRRYYIVLTMMIIILMLILMAMAFLLSHAAGAHSWYKQRVDPVFGNECCGGTDCGQLKIGPGVISAETDGYRVRLTLEQAKAINPEAMAPLDALITWRRVQPSEDGDFHICIMKHDRTPQEYGVFCFFAPPNT